MRPYSGDQDGSVGGFDRHLQARSQGAVCVGRLSHCRERQDLGPVASGDQHHDGPAHAVVARLDGRDRQIQGIVVEDLPVGSHITQAVVHHLALLQPLPERRIGRGLSLIHI